MGVVTKVCKKLIQYIKEGSLLVKIKRVWKMSVGLSIRRALLSRYKIQPDSVAFFTFQHRYTCNPKYICDELLRESDKVHIVWGVKDDDISSYPNDPRVSLVRINTPEYFAAVAACKTIVTNSLVGDKFSLIPVKKGQILIETWHGSLGIKRFDKDHYTSSASWPVAMSITGKRTNYCLSNSTFEDRIYKKTFWPDTPILRYGHARNDVFFDNYSAQREKWRESFYKEHNLDAETKLLIYAPTFRDDGSVDAYVFDVDRVLDALEKRFGGHWVMMLRYHPTALKKLADSDRDILQSNRIIDVSQVPDIQEMLTFVDAGISDYSSWVFDYVLSRKPVFLLTQDLEHFQEVERGLEYSIRETPFSIAADSDELVNNILAFDEAEYLARVEAFLKEKGCIEDGHAAERAAHAILTGEYSGII